MLLRFAVLFAVACAAMPRATAAAQAVALEPVPRRLVLAGQLGYFGDVANATSDDLVSAQLSGLYAFDEHWSLALDLGALWLSSSPDRGEGDTTLRPGNPTAFALLRLPLAPFEVTVGVGAAAPLAVIEREGAGRLQHLAYNRVQGMSGLWDVWAWAPSRGAVLGYARAGLPISPYARVELETEPALMIPAREAYVDEEPAELFVPVALSASARLSIVAAGVRLQSVFTTSGTDPLQLSLVPWVRVRVFTGFVETRVVACIGEPLVGKRGPGAYGIFLAGGAPL